MPSYEVKFTIESDEKDDIQWSHLREELQVYFDSYPNNISVTPAIVKEIENGMV